MLRIILCSGIKRSASTWSYNVCRLYAELIAKSKGAELISRYTNDTDKFVRTLEEEVRKRRSAGKNANIVAVLKAHEVGNRTRSLITQGKIHNIYTIRDPRDSLASMEKFWPLADEDKKFDERIREFQRWLIDGDAFLQDNHSLIVRYEDMRIDPIEQIRRIAMKLNIKCTEKKYQEIHNATNEDAGHKIINELMRNKDTLNRTHCSTTQLHEKHLNGGHIGRWRKELSPLEQAKAETAFYPWFEKFGYSIGDKEKD